MKTTLLTAAVLVTLLFIVIACTSQDTKLIGRWEGAGPKGAIRYEFNSDHGYAMGDEYGEQKGTRRLTGGKLMLKITSMTLTKKYAVEMGLPEADFPRTESGLENAPETAVDITLSGDELTLTVEGTTVTLKKK